MLDMRPDCERCGTDLPAQDPGAFICSFECTFCADCANELDDLCARGMLVRLLVILQAFLHGDHLDQSLCLNLHLKFCN